MKMKLAEYVGEVLTKFAVSDTKIFVLDGDLADSDGAEIFAKDYPSRFLMAGIAEQNIVSVSAGMADAGLRPWVFSFASFLCYRAYDQIRICVSQAKQPVTLIGSHAGGLTGRNGKTHSALNDLAIMLSLPGIQVWAPGDFADVELAVRYSLQGNIPSYIRLPRRVFTQNDNLPGTVNVTRCIYPPQPVTILSTGLASHWAYGAAQRLIRSGYCIGLLHYLRLSPWVDIKQYLVGVKHLVIVEDHYKFGGLASLVYQLNLPATITVFGWPEEYSGKSGSDDELLAYYGLSEESLASAIEARFSPQMTRDI